MQPLPSTANPSIGGMASVAPHAISHQEHGDDEIADLTDARKRLTTAEAAITAEASTRTEDAQDAVGAMVQSSTKVSLTYVDATPSLKADIIAGSLGAADMTNRFRSVDFRMGDFIPTIGAPDRLPRGLAALYQGWSFDAAVTEQITAQLIMPDNTVNGSNCNLVLYWTNGGAGAGNVRWNVQLDDSSAGTNVNTGAGAVSQAATVAAPLLNVLAADAFATAVLPTGPQHFVNILISRDGANPADTLTNDVWLVGVRVDYLADS